MYNALEEGYSKKMKKEQIQELLETTLKSFIYKEINRSPVIVPVYMEV